MKYERMKKSKVRCNAVEATGSNFIKKLSADIQLARKTAYDVAFKVRQKFPDLIRKVSQQVDDPSVESRFKAAFASVQIEMKHVTSYIESAAKQLNKGSLTACVKFLKLARWSMLQAYEATEKLDDDYYRTQLGEVAVTAARITGILSSVADELEDDIRKIGSIIV